MWGLIWEWFGGAGVGDTLVQAEARRTGDRGGPGAWGVSGGELAWLGRPYRFVFIGVVT